MPIDSGALRRASARPPSNSRVTNSKHVSEVSTRWSASRSKAKTITGLLWRRSRHSFESERAERKWSGIRSPWRSALQSAPTFYGKTLAGRRGAARNFRLRRARCGGEWCGFCGSLMVFSLKTAWPASLGVLYSVILGFGPMSGKKLARRSSPITSAWQAADRSPSPACGSTGREATGGDLIQIDICKKGLACFGWVLATDPSPARP